MRKESQKKTEKNLKTESNTQGLTICYFGDGKGKTTAALGLALRAAGYNKKVKIIQFIKGPWKSGEFDSIKNLKSIKISKQGRGFVGLGNKVDIKEHQIAAQEALKQIKTALTSNYDIVVADEILGAITGKLISVKDVVKLIENKKRNVDLVLTGKKEYPEITKRCDLVTQMVKVKHPYDQGILAKEGIDY